MSDDEAANTVRWSGAVNIVRWVGVDKHGDGRAGMREGMSGADIAEKLFTAGYRRATVWFGDEVVGAVVRDEHGQRTWWGQPE
jgi:hypothetical protein